ncbi:MAG TPA: 16S rRNA (guanine(527)-N(7))-methyltransferase RsmG [Alphaproteobacteria bacterium]|nr:16S rRNA (guanine(527)-N(7))-methyltransferase RsmG [Alphaproteobacteria bacterium]
MNQKLYIYKSLLLKWSKAINLVAPSTLTEIETRHFEDSLQLLPHIPEETKTLIDIGSGAGFPGLALALARASFTVHLVESDQKKCAFLSTVSRETFTPIIIHNNRVENVDIKEIGPEIVTARALASLTDLLTMTQNWWQIIPSLTLIFLKGEKADDEIADALRKFKFSFETIQSKTDPKGCVLILKNVSAKE